MSSLSNDFCINCPNPCRLNATLQTPHGRKRIDGNRVKSYNKADAKGREETNMRDDIVRLSRRYPQLLLPIRAGTRQTEEYQSAVLCGEALEREPDFLCPEEIELSACDTPAGRAESVYFGRREDFVHAYRALAYRCEPAEIPDSVGAGYVGGLINWEKIHSHRDEYLAAGGEDWEAEFKRFTSDKRNYRDSLILLSGGEYSNIPAADVGLDEESWRRLSVVIRRYHELTHFVCRGLYPENIDALRDEVIADAIGLVAAFGRYDTALAARFLGAEGESFREGGRLSHYVKDGELPEALVRAKVLIAEYAGRIRRAQPEAADVFDLLLRIFP